MLEAKALLMRTFSVVSSGTVSPSGVWRSDHVRRTIVTVFEALGLDFRIWGFEFEHQIQG